MSLRPIYLPGRALSARDLNAEHDWRDTLSDLHADLVHPQEQGVGASVENAAADVRLIFERLADNTRQLLVQLGARLRLSVRPLGRRRDVEIAGPLACRGLAAKRLAMSKPVIGSTLKVPFVLTYRVPEPNAEPETAGPAGLVIQLAAPREDGERSGLVVGRAKDETFMPQLTIETGGRLRIRGKLQIKAPGRLIEKPPTPAGFAETPSDEQIMKAWLRTPAGAVERERISGQYDGKFLVGIQAPRRVGGQLRYRLTVKNQGPETVRELQLHQALLPKDVELAPTWQAIPTPPGLALAPKEKFELAVTFDLPAEAQAANRLGVHAAALITYDLTITAFQPADIK